MMLIFLIALTLILIGFFTGNWAITAMGVIAGILLFAFSNRTILPSKAEEIEYTHTVLSSEPPEERFPHPQEMQLPFHPIIEKTLEGKEVRSDALPFPRTNLKNPLLSMFSMIPFNPLHKKKEKK